MDEVELFERYISFLLKSLKEVYCTVCGYWISDGQTWMNYHLPYIEITDDFIKLGYRCSKAKDPIIIVVKKKGAIDEDFTRVLE